MVDSLNDFAKEVHKNAVSHGWWEKPKSFGEIIALCHSELSEALEEYRDGKPTAYFMRECSTFPQYDSSIRLETDFSKLKKEKPEGVAIELADCIIRILDYCGHEGIDIEHALMIKHAYNEIRPYRHGGKVI